eukprot:2711132-Pyramimonas_sp.AAC.1
MRYHFASALQSHQKNLRRYVPPSTKRDFFEVDFQAIIDLDPLEPEEDGSRGAQPVRKWAIDDPAWRLLEHERDGAHSLQGRQRDAQSARSVAHPALASRDST